MNQNRTAEIEEAVEGWRHRSQTLHFTYGLILLARAQLRTGQADLALQSVEEAMRWSRAHHQHYADSELRRLAGEALRQAGDSQAAVRSFRKALDVARSQECRWFELKAACSLAGLETTESNRQLVRELLGQISGSRDLPLLRRASELVTVGRLRADPAFIL